VSVGTPLSLVMGILLIFGGLALFFLGNFKPELKRDSDNIYAILAIICGFIGVISFARKDFDESIEQLLLVGMAVFLMWENIRNRTPNALPTTSNKREEERGSRRPYRAERVNEYEEFGSSRSGGAGLGGSRGGYEDYSYSDRSLPRRDERDSRRGRDERDSRREEDSRGGRDEFREEPRSIPERSSRSNRDDRDRTSRDRSSRDTQSWDDSSTSRESNNANNARDNSNRDSSNRDSSNRGEERSRRRRPDEEGARPRRRATRVEDVNSEGEEIPAADYTEFTPLEEKPSNSGSSWGPQ
jgi:hypothetical protein